MIKQLEQVKQFHTAFGLRIANNLEETFSIDEGDFEKLLKLRGDLIQEETKELLAELSTDLDMHQVAKEAADLCYVIFGLLLSLGLQDKFGEVFDEVHRSNMSKLTKDGKVLRREDGKVLKSDQYSKADLTNII